mgnify:CR=1 FL=1
MKIEQLTCAVGAELIDGGPWCQFKSPKTGKTYTMQCTSTMTDVWPEAKRCVGVNDTGHGLIVIIS